MNEFTSLLANAVTAGVLLGGFYAAAATGVSIAFGMLGIVNIAHPAFILAGGFAAYTLNERIGLDPIVGGLLLTPAFYGLGVLAYSFYEYVFERRGSEAIRGLAFFFGILFITEVSLLLTFGVDYRLIETSYSSESLHAGSLDFPLRLFIPFVISMVMIAALHLFFSRTFIGRAIIAVSQDPIALKLMGGDPVSMKRIAFGLSVGSAALAGGLLVTIQAIEPSIARDYIGRLFAITVLGGAGSLAGMVVGGIILGVAESLTSTFYGPSWAPAVAFGFLLLTLVFRPSGLFGQA